MPRALILYWSKTGNTEKVAVSIQEGLKAGGFAVVLKRIGEEDDVDFFDYDLVCFGCPSYNWHPPKPADRFLRARFAKYRESKVVVNAPTVPGKTALVFVTYSGPHTGIRDALPAGKYVGQFFEHLGFVVLDEWYVLSEFHGAEDCSTIGRMGNIKGLPSEEDLARIAEQARLLALRIRSMGVGGPDGPDDGEGAARQCTVAQPGARCCRRKPHGDQTPVGSHRWHRPPPFG